MTENEKAATYIGWKPKTWCGECEIIGKNKHADLKAKFNLGHYVPAPDMSLPNNYMKALEGLPPEWGWTVNRGPRGNFTVRIWDVMYGKGESCRSAVEALAALWDAENGSKDS